MLVAEDEVHEWDASIDSNCINCKQKRPCIKVEARAPLAHGPVLVWNDTLNVHETVEYGVDGPMVEICRECLRTDIGTLANYLLESL